MTYLDRVIKATQDFDEKRITIQEWVKILLGEDCVNMYSDEYCRRAEKIFSSFASRLEREEVKDLTGEEILERIEKAKRELAEEKVRVQTENLQFNANKRFVARHDLFNEKIISAIDRLEPIRVPDGGLRRDQLVHQSALLCLTDFHAGSTYTVKGLYNEVVNAYSYDIMVARLWKLLDDICNDDISYDDITVACLGDYFENILRPSSLTKLREPVIDTVIKFSEFMAQYLTEMQNRLGIPVNVLFVGGNHDVNRPLGSYPIDEDENLGKIVHKFVEIRLENNPYITVKPYTDVAIENIRGNNLMFTHGEDKNLVETLEYFSNLYQVDCDAIYTGHLHRPESKTVGISDLGDREIFRCGSICGVDPYAKSIRKAARPSALMTIYSENGRGWQKNYYLG